MLLGKNLIGKVTDKNKTFFLLIQNGLSGSEHGHCNKKVIAHTAANLQ